MPIHKISFIETYIRFSKSSKSILYIFSCLSINEYQLFSSDLIFYSNQLGTCFNFYLFSFMNLSSKWQKRKKEPDVCNYLEWKKWKEKKSFFFLFWIALTEHWKKNFETFFQPFWFSSFFFHNYLTLLFPTFLFM